MDLVGLLEVVDLRRTTQATVSKRMEASSYESKLDKITQMRTSIKCAYHFEACAHSHNSNYKDKGYKEWDRMGHKQCLIFI